MKKLLKNFAILTVFACGLFTGCNNDASIDLNVTVSTDTPSLDEPENLGYGVLLTWGVTQDDNNFQVTRQAKDGKEKILDKISDNRYLDSVRFDNVLEEGVEYTYRVYNLGGDAYSADNGVVKYSYAEKKITLAAGSLKKQGEKLDAVKEDDVKCSFKNGYLKINFLNDENCAWGRDFVVRDVETGRKVSVSFNHEEGKYYSYDKIDAEKVNVEIKNVSYDGYYADSDVVTIENIENTVAEGVEIFNFKATKENKTVVLSWITEEKVEASEFTIQKAIEIKGDYSKFEVLKITPVCEENNDGTYCWKAIDETIVVGAIYGYKVTTDSDYKFARTYSENVYISNLTATVRDKTVVLLWTTEEKVEASEFTIQRAKRIWDELSERYNYLKPEVLKITPAYEEKYDGTYYWKAIDETVEVGTYYKYEVITNVGSSSNYLNYNCTVDIPGNIKITDGRYSTVDNAVTLTWEATDGISDFKIYRADKNMSSYGGLDENANYDLYKPLNITFEKVDSTLDDKKEIEAVYTAKDTTVEKGKHYTYRITSADGLDCSWNYAVRTSQYSYSGDFYVSLNGSEVYDNGYISNTTDDILLSFNYASENLTYKGYYTTVDNKGNESARKSFDFTKDNDTHYRKTFKASAITGLEKAVSVNFYVKCYDGDKLLEHWDDDAREFVYEYTKTFRVDSSLTTYTTFSVYASQEDLSKKEITIYASGYNLDTKAITVTYFKNDGEVKTPTSALIWTKVSDDYYKATLTVTETGSYKICATIPEDNAYDSTYGYYPVTVY